MNYRLFGRSGLRVSEISLGTMTFGEEWGYGANIAESRKVFDAYREAGGNFYDTANRYTEGTSEEYLGEFIKDAGIRTEAVIATKYSLYTNSKTINDGGNHRKNMMQSVDGSLKRLDTDYIDILYLHAWDFTTPIDEVMRGLDDLVRSGKVLYVAISDTPAWVIAEANEMARNHGWNPFVGMQMEYSLITRDIEREILPYAEHSDMAIVAWGPLAGGALTGKYLNNNNDPKRLKEDSKRLNERSTEIAQVVVDTAKEVGCTPAQLALKWVMQKSPAIIPVVGARNAEQLKDSLKVLDIELPEEQFNKLNEISAIELGFPHDFLASDGVQHVLHGGLADKIKYNHR